MRIKNNIPIYPIMVIMIAILGGFLFELIIGSIK